MAVAATSHALAERFQTVCDTVTLFYNKTKEKLGTLKRVGDEAEKEHEEDQEQLDKQQDEVDLPLKNFNSH